MKTISKLFSVCFNSFWRFQPIFSFCVVGPYLSFSSSKFKLILKRFGEKIYFSSKKMCFDISSQKSFPNIFSFFLLFLTFLIDFQLLCSLAVLVVSQQVLNDLNRFGRVQSKNVFYDEHFFLAAWSWQCLAFLERLKLTFSSFRRFWPSFWFCAVWPYFLLLSKFDLGRFCTTWSKISFLLKVVFAVYWALLL